MINKNESPDWIPDIDLIKNNLNKEISKENSEQMDFKMPDYVAVSVGDGCTIAGVWKGFKDLYATGIIDRLPRLISVQAAGCCPINTAIETGNPWQPMEENTIADSIAVGVPRNPDKALNAIRESKGIVVNGRRNFRCDAAFGTHLRTFRRTCGSDRRCGH